MRVLALDAATEACSVALLTNGAAITRTMESGKGNAPNILRMVEEVLAEGQVSLSMLDGSPPAWDRALSPASGSAWRSRRVWHLARA